MTCAEMSEQRSARELHSAGQPVPDTDHPSCLSGNCSKQEIFLQKKTRFSRVPGTNELSAVSCPCFEIIKCSILSIEFSSFWLAIKVIFQ